MSRQRMQSFWGCELKECVNVDCMHPPLISHILICCEGSRMYFSDAAWVFVVGFLRILHSVFAFFPL